MDSSPQGEDMLLAEEASLEYQHMNMSSHFTPITADHGHISVIGRRRSMEDAVTVVPNLVQVTWADNEDHNTNDDNTNKHAKKSSTYDFFAVYDGDGGYEVANKYKERLHHLVADEAATRTSRGGLVDWDAVMANSFAKMEEEAEEEGYAEEGYAATKAKTMGSMALVLVGMEDVVVANSGKCKVVLLHGGAALPLSREHKPERPDGKQRVDPARGNRYLIFEPEVKVYKRNASDNFLVIGSDGLWDVVSNEAACDLVKECFCGQVSRTMFDGVSRNCAAAAATMLAELAIARGSRDNISVIVVQLQPSYHTCST